MHLFPKNIPIQLQSLTLSKHILITVRTQFKLLQKHELLYIFIKMIPHFYQPSYHKKKCWNGEDCKYLKQHRCFFYHPLDHYLYNNIEPPEEMIQEIIGEKQNNPQQKIESKQQDKKTIILNGIKIKLLPNIQTNLVCHKKAWFFKQARHFQYREGIQQEQCSICLDNYKDEKLMTQLFCNHIFHKICIQKWLVNSNLCPLCKKDFSKHPQYSNLPGYFSYKLHQFHFLPELESSQNQDIDFDEFNNSYNAFNYSFYASHSVDNDDVDLENSHSLNSAEESWFNQDSYESNHSFQVDDDFSIEPNNADDYWYNEDNSLGDDYDFQ